MDDCTQGAMLRCMHVLSITGCRSNSSWETDLNTNTSKYYSAGLIITEKQTSTEKLKKVTGQWNIRHLEIIKTNILSKIHDDHFKMWPLEPQQGFPLIWPGDLVSNIKWPSFKLDLEIIKTNIFSNIYDHYLKNVTRSVNKVFLWFGLVT